MCTPPPKFSPGLRGLDKLEIARQIALSRRTFQPSELSEADQHHLAQLRQHQELVRAQRVSRWVHRSPESLPSLWTRLKARAARVSWDSWG